MGDDVPPAADDKKRRKRARRTNRLSDSLRGLPTTIPEIIDTDAFRLIGEEDSEGLHASPTSFTLEIIKRLTHGRRDDPDAAPLTPPL